MYSTLTLASGQAGVEVCKKMKVRASRARRMDSMITKSTKRLHGHGVDMSDDTRARYEKLGLALIAYATVLLLHSGISDNPKR